LKEGDH